MKYIIATTEYGQYILYQKKFLGRRLQIGVFDTLAEAKAKMKGRCEFRSHERVYDRHGQPSPWDI